MPSISRFVNLQIDLLHPLGLPLSNDKIESVAGKVVMLDDSFQQISYLYKSMY